MASGGYKRPSNPAPVSGPGALSQRTDGGPGSTQSAKYISGLPYGEGQQMMDLQSSSPMEAAAPIPTIPPSAIASAGNQQPQEQPAQQANPIIPLSMGTQRPNEPVTSGANAGPGPDLASLNLPNPTVTAYTNARDYINQLASSSSSSPALQFLAQRINGTF